ncbi:CLUMA_CG007166, isoform A [Clunio marinus]|uniref:CLUMA_CG007166, isoform A n=1 Tax=Clunio marinus TaxID=568069 RepID=A0A1J1I223_9DIPT|nr:CLUMA_CG007166, isoform A [Clunio marinus]
MLCDENRKENQKVVLNLDLLLSRHGGSFIHVWKIDELWLYADIVSRDFIGLVCGWLKLCRLDASS